MDLWSHEPITLLLNLIRSVMMVSWFCWVLWASWWWVTALGSTQTEQGEHVEGIKNQTQCENGHEKLNKQRNIRKLRFSTQIFTFPIFFFFLFSGKICVLVPVSCKCTPGEFYFNLLNVTDVWCKAKSEESCKLYLKTFICDVWSLLFNYPVGV